jgi:TetR/AcrR family transcriptional regulator, regulator of cefoperazone and chloramphenicol sensitivity
MEVAMDLKKMDTKSRIMATAIEIMGRNANIDVTVREIARQANVNIASINYYFGSKEQLFIEVENTLVRGIDDIYGVLSDNSNSMRVNLINWADDLMQYLLEYPGIIFLWASRVIKDKTDNQDIIKLIAYSEVNLNEIVKQLTGTANADEIEFKVIQLISSIISPVIMYLGIGEHLVIDINDAAVRKSYITSLIDSIIS